MARRRYGPRRAQGGLGTPVMPPPMPLEDFLSNVGNALLGFACVQICQAIDEVTTPPGARHRTRHEVEKNARQQGRSEVIREIARGKRN